MNRRGFAATCCLCIGLSLSAQEVKEPLGGVSVSRQLYSFSPLGAIYVRALSMEDKNSNGVIDKNAGEGYEEFSAHYGNADTGFAANGVIYGAANGSLEEPEIVNHYYLTIRFKEPEITETIENEVNAYIYANNIPLVWLDDEQGTVMSAVNRILGAGWNEQEVTGDEAARMFRRARFGMGIIGRTGTPNKTGYYTLSEFITKKTGYCFEAAEFGFWFFSELKHNTTIASTMLTTNTRHGVVKFANGDRIDYFGTSNRYRTTDSQWNIVNPIQSLSQYYEASANTIQNDKNASLSTMEKAWLYNKYDIYVISSLIKDYSDITPAKNEDIISLGEFFLQNTDITALMNTTVLDKNKIINNFRTIILFMAKSYSLLGNSIGFRKMKSLIDTHFAHDNEARDYINYYDVMPVTFRPCNFWRLCLIARRCQLF
jgi:hypothetical protein